MIRNSFSLTIAIMILSFQYVISQDFSFATNLNIQTPNGFKENKVLISGNDIFIVGNFSAATSFGGGGTGTAVTPQSNDIYILRYSSTGSLVSQMFVSGTDNQILTSATMDPGGWLYICGKYATGGSVGSTALAAPIGSYDMFVAKVNPYSSQTIWVTNLGSTLDDEATDIGIAVENGYYFVYITGNYYGATLNVKSTPTSTITAKHTNSQANSYDGVLVKFNALNGNYLNSRNMGGTGNDYTRALAINSVSYPTSYTMVQIFGEYYSTNFKADVGATLTNNGYSDIYQASFYSYYNSTHTSTSPSSNFEYYFSKGFGSTGYEYVNDAVSLTNGNTVVVGSFYGSMNISDGSNTVTLTANESTYSDVFIACFAPYISLNWAKSFGGNYYDKPSGIASDNSNNFYLVGNTQSISIDLDPSPTKSTTYTNSGYALTDYFLSKFNASGEFIWGQKGGGTGDDRLYSIFVNSSEQQFVTGAFSGTNDFNLGTAINNLTSIGSDDHFLAKYACTGGMAVTSQPESLVVCNGSSATLSFGVSGTDVKYQWYKDGQPINGATASTYSISNTNSNHVGNYMCIASKICQSDIQSNTVSISLKYPVYAFSSDNTYTYEICQGSTKTLRVSTNNGTTPFSYQWYKNEVFSGNTTDSLRISNIDASKAGTYRCRVSNSCNYSDVSFTVVYNSPLSITQQPQPVSKTIGENASIGISLSGSGTHYTTWYQDGQSKYYVDNVTFNPLNGSSMGNYYSVTSNACNTVTSNEILVDVQDNEVYPAGWKFQANSGSYRIYDIYMYNKFVGYAAKYGNPSQPLLYTEDGGKTWINDNISNMQGPSYLYSVYATSSNRVYVGDLGYIYHKYSGNWYSTQIPVTDQVRDITFVDQKRGWAVGNNGMVLTTYDGGWSWKKAYYGDGPMTSSHLYGVSFVDADTGFIASYSDRNIYQTTDGGANWQPINPSVSTNWRDVSVAGRSVYVAGNYGWVYYSHDAGNTWNWSNTNQSTITKISAIDSKHAFASYAYGVNYTRDGGNTWSVVPVNGAIYKMTAMHYTDTLNGWYAGYYDIFRTANSGCLAPRVNLGLTSQDACGSILLRADTVINSRNDNYKWSNGSTLPTLKVTSGEGVEYRVTVSNICGYSHADTVNVTIKPLPLVNAGRDTGFIIGQTVTLQGGPVGASYSWLPATGLNNPNSQTPVFSPSAQGVFTKGLTATANGCSATDSVRIEVFGVRNMPAGWLTASTPTGSNIINVHFANDSVGWAISNSNELLFSNTGGAIWRDSTSKLGAYAGSLKQVQFINVQSGWVLTSNQIARTINAGRNWTLVSLPVGCTYNNFKFIDINNGWAVGSSGSNKFIAYTTNGGLTWTTQTIPINVSLNSVCFVNSSLGFACGDGGYVFIYNSSWPATSTGTSKTVDDLKQIQFVSTAVGWALSPTNNGGWSTGSNTLYKSINGGSSFESQPIIDSNYPSTVFKIYSMYFVDANVGFLSTDGGILRTNNGGTTWSYLPIQPDISNVKYFTVMYTDANNGWVGGFGGRIKRTARGGCLDYPKVTLATTAKVCPNSNIQIDVSAKADSVKNANVVWNWTPGGVSTSKNTISTPATYTVSATNLCNLNTSKSITVTPYSVASINVGKDSTFCQNKPYTFNTIGAVTKSTFQWLTTDYLNETNIANPSLGTIPSGIYNFIVQVTDSNLCKKVDTVQLTIRAQPSSKFTIGSTEICNGDSLLVTLQSYDSGISANYLWNFNGGGTSPARVTSEGLQYKVKWSGSDTSKSIALRTFKAYSNPSITCNSDTTTSKIKIKPMSEAGFILSNAPYCTSDTIKAIYKGSPSGKTFSWTVAGTEYQKGNTNDTFVFVTKMQKSNTPLNLTVTKNACSKDSNAFLNIYEKPFFKLESLTQVCSGQGIELTHQLSNKQGYIYNWNLDGGKRLKGDSINGYTVQWDTAGLKTISLQILNQGCAFKPSNKLIQVKPTPKAGFNLPEKVCQRDTLFITYGGIASNTATVNWEAQDANIYATSGLDRKVFFSKYGVKTIKQFIVDAGCNSDTLSKSIEVIENPNNQLTIPANNVCAGTNFSINSIGKNFGAQSSYKWQLNGATIVSGDTINGYTVKWDTVGTKNISLEINNKGCKDTIKSKTIEVKYVPTSDFSFKSPQCFDDTVLLSFTGNAQPSATATWNYDGGIAINNDGFNRKVKYSTGGLKNLSLSLSDNGCNSSITSKSLTVSYPAETPICMVTVDPESGKNMVIWEPTKNLGVKSFNIYKKKAGVYNVISNIPISKTTGGIYVDQTSTTRLSEIYKLTSVDTCGNEFPIDKAKFHQPLFLQWVSSDNGINLSWDSYKVEGGQTLTFKYYIIYRGTDSTKLAPLDTVENENSSYVDDRAEAKLRRTFYRVAGVRADSCLAFSKLKANSGPFSHSVSNLEDNRLRSSETGVNQTYNFAFNVVPNPLAEEFEVKLYVETKGNLKIDLFNSLGKNEAQLINSKVLGGNQKFNFNASKLKISKGIYFLKVTFNGSVSTKKIVVQ